MANSWKTRTGSAALRTVVETGAIGEFDLGEEVLDAFDGGDGCAGDGVRNGGGETIDADLHRCHPSMVEHRANSGASLRGRGCLGWEQLR